MRKLVAKLRGERGDVDVALVLLVFTFIGVVLLLFGVKL